MHRYTSFLGEIILSSDGSALNGLWFSDQKHFTHQVISALPEADLSVFEQTDRWLDQYFNHIIPAFTPPLSVYGTPFQLQVWKLLLTIPCGKTATYGELASLIAVQNNRPHMSAQAVGNAVGANPVSLIIPCHRIIGRNGSLTGYAGGLERKAALLALEQKTVRQI